MHVSPAIIVLTALGLLLLTGCVLFVWGLLGRRVGGEPHCRRCGYNLTGLVSQKCPECGTNTLGKNVVIGVRRRRRRALVAAIMMLVLSIGGLGSALYLRTRSVNSYSHLPTFVVVWRAEADDSDAIRELVRRCKSGALQEQKLIELVPVALRQQDFKRKTSNVWAWTDFLAVMDLAGMLMPKERERFRDHMVSCELKFRSTIRRGDELPWFFEYWMWGAPGVCGTVRIEKGELRIDDWTQDYHYLGEGWLSNTGSGGSFGYRVPTDQLEPGTYKVLLRATKVFTDPSFERPVELSGKLEVLPPEAPDTVRLIDDPTLAGQLKKGISFTTSNEPRGGFARPGSILIEIAITGCIPLDCAFDVIARVGERELNLGMVKIKKAESSNLKSRWGCDSELLNAAFFVPVLRTSVAAAKETADMFEIWNGELVFDPVPVPPALDRYPR